MAKRSNAGTGKAGSPQYPNIRKEWLRQCEELYDVHEKRVFRFLSDSENSKIRVGFGTTIDMSETKPLVKTSIRYSEVITDERSGEAVEEGQGSLPMEGVEGWQPTGEPPSGTPGEPPTTVEGRAEPEASTEGKSEKGRRPKAKRGKEAAAGDAE